MIYFDWNATAPLHPVAQAKMMDILSHPPQPANPSSLHRCGRTARHLLDTTKELILQQLHDVKGRYKIIFTSSGTESNNQILYSFMEREVFLSNIEHPSILKNKGNHNILIPCDSDGYVTPQQVEEIIIKHKPQDGFLVSVMHANNETGIVNDIAKIADIIHKNGGLLHSDLSQSVGRIPVNLTTIDLDYATISGHKLGAMNGVAILLYRDKLPISPILKGGSQESGLRAGTENTMAIQSLSYIFEELPTTLNAQSNVAALRDAIEQGIDLRYGAPLVQENINRLPNTTMITMHGVPNTTQVIFFDLNNIAVSNGAACSTGSMEPSHVLQAMGIDTQTIEKTIRISLGFSNTADEVACFLKRWHQMAGCQYHDAH